MRRLRVLTCDATSLDENEAPSTYKLKFYTHTHLLPQLVV